MSKVTKLTVMDGSGKILLQLDSPKVDELAKCLPKDPAEFLKKLAHYFGPASSRAWEIDLSE